MNVFGNILQKRRYWCSIFVLMGVFSVMAAWKFGYQEMFEQRERLRSAYTGYQQQVVAQESNLSVESSLQTAANEVGEIRQKLLFQSEERNSAEIIPFVVKVLDEISARHDVTLDGVKPLAPQVVLMLEERPFDITIRGDYKDLFEWVLEAEESLSPMSIKSFQLNPGGRDTDVEMRLRVVSYRLPRERT